MCTLILCKQILDNLCQIYFSFFFLHSSPKLKKYFCRANLFRVINHFSLICSLRHVMLKRIFCSYNIIMVTYSGRLLLIAHNRVLAINSPIPPWRGALRQSKIAYSTGLKLRPRNIRYFLLFLLTDTIRGV